MLRIASFVTAPSEPPAQLPAPPTGLVFDHSGNRLNGRKGARGSFGRGKAWVNGMPAISLEQANTIIKAALAEGRARNLQPLTVAVLDPGGHLVALQREDNSGILRVGIAIGKAYGALGMGFGSREFVERSQKTPAFVGALTVLSQGRLVPVPGGVLIRDASGALLGAVGISGDTSDQDEACAVKGIEAAGLTPQVGA